MARRSTRDWIVDILCVVVSAAGGALLLILEAEATPLPYPIGIDIAIGVAALVAIWFRRRRPIGVALFLVLPIVVSASSSIAALIALVTVAVHRRASLALLVAGLQTLASVGYSLLRPSPDMSLFATTLTSVLASAAFVGWGMYVRARRQLVASLRERAERAEAEQALRAEQARRAERARIAREMHDVLGHRISLIALQAGGLEVGTALPPHEAAAAAGLIRETARQALIELRDVVGVLREDQPHAALAPQPTFHDITRLVDDSRNAGADVRLEMAVSQPESVPGPLGRAAYRIVQEALTNVHKHARGATTTVLLDGAPAHGLQVRVRNPIPPDGAPSWPGGGQGLIGLAERVALAGGTLTHGPDAGEFVVDARLTWA